MTNIFLTLFYSLKSIKITVEPLMIPSPTTGVFFFGENNSKILSTFDLELS